jgi:hypothetical protein
MAAQLALYEPQLAQTRAARRRSEAEAPLCASCRAREARYGFQPDRHDPQVERPRALCFECFRLEMGRRQARVEVAARAIQVRLPLPPHRADVRDRHTALEHTLDALSRRRRRAQIAARKALG